MERSARRSALRAALIFFVVTALLTLIYHLHEYPYLPAWNRLARDAGAWRGVWVSVRGGLLFAAATACLIYYLLGRELSALERAEEQRAQALVAMEKLAAGASRQASELDAIIRSIADAVMVYNAAGVLTSANPAAVELLGVDSLEFSSVNLFQSPFIRQTNGEALAAEELPAARALRGETVRGERLTCQTAQGEARVMVVTAAPLVESGRTCGAVQVWHDVTEREQLLSRLEQRVREYTRELSEANRLLEERVAERTREIAPLLDISLNLTSPLELRPQLQQILDQLRMLVAYDAAALIEEQENSLLTLSYRGPLRPERVYGLRFDPARLPGYQAVREADGPVIVADLREDGALAQALSDSSRNPLFAGGRAWMGVPIVIKGRMIAMLGLEHNTPGYYTVHYARLAQTIANQAAVVIEIARLHREGLRAAVLEELQRVARELHDSIAQGLYGVVLGANSAREVISRDPRQAAKMIDDVRVLAEGSLTEMRALIFELRPESLQRDDLVPALERLASVLEARYHIPVFTDLAVEPALSLGAKENLYRIAQEALHNVAKHAGASRAGLRLYGYDGRVVLEVSDDGAGFDPSQSFPGHLGLHSMRERAESMSGTLDISNAEGQGTVVRVEVRAA